ncbi:hypothetical protein FAIPA1_10347 [Frankia sp. AiPs1]
MRGAKTLRSTARNPERVLQIINLTSEKDFDGTLVREALPEPSVSCRCGLQGRLDGIVPTGRPDRYRGGAR